MKKKFLKNNKGSSLVIVLIAVAFVSILTAIILSAASANYRLRVMNNNSKKTFYSAETALEEVYAGLGEVVCDVMELSYLSVAQNLSYKKEVGGYEYTIKIDNDTANADLKKKYYDSIYSIIVAEDNAGTLCEYLSGFLSAPANAYVSGYGKITYDEARCVILIEDVIVQYKEENRNYFSNVATDIELKYPDKDFDFISNTKSNLETFLDYSIIAMDGVDVGYGKAANATFAGGIFAGAQGSETKGLTINENSTLNVGNSILKSNIISAADVNIKNRAKLNFGQGRLWCDNINIGANGHNEASAFFGDSTIVYAADDLNIAGNKCSVTLGSDYSGYGISVKDAAGNLNVDGTNSAIVINGKDSVLYAPALSRFVLAGSAYLNFDEKGTQNYLTSESISIKGNQEIFLVPTIYLEKKATAPEKLKITNPMRGVDSTYVQADLTGFFAYELLDPVNPYTVKVVNTSIFYFYLNFKDDKAQQEYVKCILSESYLKNHIVNKGENWERDRSELYAFITNSMKKFVLQGAIDLGYNSGAKVYAGGNLYEIGTVDSNKIMSSEGSTVNFMNSEEVIRYSNDKRNRYDIIMSYLYDVGSDTEVKYGDSSLPMTITIAGIDYLTGDVYSTSIYDRTIDSAALSTAALDKNIKDNTNIIYENLRPDGTIAAAVRGGTYYIPENRKGGVVVGYECNIVVSGEYEGLIITNGKVYVNSNGGELITNGVRDVASRILDEDINISKYFYSYQMDSDNFYQSSIVDVKDLLGFNNWRKNYAD